jgi:hypothetical protein
MSHRAKAALVLAVSLVAAIASGQAPQRTLGVRFANGTADVTYSAADFADAGVRTLLESGVLQTIIVRTYAYEAGSTAPIAVTAHSCGISWDPWDATFTVLEQSPTVDRRVVSTTIDEVIARCLVMTHEPIGTASAWAAYRGHRVTFGVVVELNPLTPDGVQRLRRWLARPEGGASPDDAFFGSFVSLFVNRGIGAAERTLSFQSQDVACP